MIKNAKKLTAAILASVILLTPCTAFAGEGILSGIGNDFYSFLGIDKNCIYEPQDETPAEENEEISDLVADESSATVYLPGIYMSVKAQSYNMLFKKWLPVNFENHGDYVFFNGLEPASFYRLRITYTNKLLGDYSFFTSPGELGKIDLKINEHKFIELKWNNPNRLLVEIFRKDDNGKWYYFTSTNEDNYTDMSVHAGTQYVYKLRFACNTPQYQNYSDFSKASTFIEDDEEKVNKIVRTHGYIYISQLDAANRSIPYPYNGNGKTIGTSGCGVCSSLMVIRNTSSYKPQLSSYTKSLINAGCRESYGSNMLKIAEYMKKTYGFKYKTTKSVSELKAHLDKGYMATAHVGTAQYFTTSTGHFVTVAGYVKSKSGDRVIVLDPGFSKSKYGDTRRVEAGIEYTTEGVLTAPFETLLDDCKGEYFVLFTP